MNPAKKPSKGKKTTNKQEEIDRLKEIAARAQADLQNAKDRIEREAVQARKFALEGFLMKLLPTVGNFQRAFAHLPDDLSDHEWVKGVATVELELMKSLSDAGLKKIESLGSLVDPEIHEVLQTGPGAANEVTEVFEEGYMLHDRVLRPAKVKVGDGS